MLRGIHKASANWLGRVVMGVVLGLIAISFAIWGIGDIFRGDFGRTTLAKVGRTDIRIDNFRQMYQDRLQELARRVGRPILPDQARALGLDRQLLGQVVADTLIDERARTLRLGMTDAELARRVTEDASFKGLTGQFDPQRFAQTIRSRGYTEARYLAEQRRNALRVQIVGTVTGDVVVPQAAVDVFSRYQNEQRTIEYVLLDRGAAGDVAAPAPDVLAKYFEERKVLFRSPEYRKVSLLLVTPVEVAPTIEVSDADVQRAYEDRKARYETPERRQIQQITFPSMDEARAAAEKIAKGTTFAAIATERGLTEADIDLGTIAKTAMVDRVVADAAFALKADEVSAPTEGRFGITLVRVLKIEPGQSRLFADVSVELKNELATERARNQMSSVHDKVEDERLSGVALVEIAKKLNLKLLSIEAVDRSGRTPDGTAVSGLPQGTDVLAAVFRADVHGDHDPLQVQGGGYVWYDVSEIKQARDRPLEEIKDQVEARWRNEEIAKRLQAKSAELLEKVKAGASLTDAAAAMKLKRETATDVKRSVPPAGVPARAIDAIFRTPKGEVAAAEGATVTDRVVFRVTDVVVPKFDPASEEAKRIDEALRRAIGDDIYAQYIAKLESEIGVTINDKALATATGASTN